MRKIHSYSYDLYNPQDQISTPVSLWEGIVHQSGYLYHLSGKIQWRTTVVAWRNPVLWPIYSMPKKLFFQLGIISPHLYMSRKNAKSKNIWLVIPCKKSFISRTVEYALDKINKWCFAHNWNFYICHYMSIFSFRLKTTEERFSAAMTAASLGEAVNAKSKVPGKLRRKPGASIFDQFWNSLGYHGCVQTMLSIMYLCICVYVSVYVCLCIPLHVCLCIWVRTYGCCIFFYTRCTYIYI